MKSKSECCSDMCVPKRNTDALYMWRASKLRSSKSDTAVALILSNTVIFILLWKLLRNWTHESSQLIFPEGHIIIPHLIRMAKIFRRSRPLLQACRQCWIYLRKIKSFNWTEWTLRSLIHTLSPGDSKSLIVWRPVVFVQFIKKLINKLFHSGVILFSERFIREESENLSATRWANKVEHSFKPHHLLKGFRIWRRWVVGGLDIF